MELLLWYLLAHVILGPLSAVITLDIARKYLVGPYDELHRQTRTEDLLVGLIWGPIVMIGTIILDVIVEAVWE
jgi:hypothetical protein